MELVAAGNKEAHDRVAARLMGRSQRLCATLLRGSADAEDASQTGLLEVLRAAGTYRGEAPLEAWADRIIVHSALRVVRERKRHFAASDEIEVAIDPPSRDDEDVLARLATLPEVCREAVVLRHVVELSIAEIASETEVSENTVKDRLLRGREMLRKSIRRDRMLGEVKK